jgi:hypothetical protein
MASIVIRDLTENTDLDQEAMAAIIGGARVRGRPVNLGRMLAAGTRIVDYPAGVKRSQSAGANAPAKRQPK